MAENGRVSPTCNPLRLQVRIPAQAKSIRIKIEKIFDQIPDSNKAYLSMRERTFEFV
jgi:hypothetical protein